MQRSQYFYLKALQVFNCVNFLKNKGIFANEFGGFSQNTILTFARFKLC